MVPWCLESGLRPLGLHVGLASVERVRSHVSRQCRLPTVPYFSAVQFFLPPEQSGPPCRVCVMGSADSRCVRVKRGISTTGIHKKTSRAAPTASVVIWGVVRKHSAPGAALASPTAPCCARIWADMFADISQALVLQGQAIICGASVARANGGFMGREAAVASAGACMHRTLARVRGTRVQAHRIALGIADAERGGTPVLCTSHFVT